MPRPPATTTAAQSRPIPRGRCARAGVRERVHRRACVWLCARVPVCGPPVAAGAAAGDDLGLRRAAVHVVRLSVGMRTTVGQQLTLVRPRACGAHHTPNHALHSVHCFAAQRATARGACMHAVYSDRESCCCQRCQGSRTHRMRTRLCDSAVDSAALISAMPRRTQHRPSAQPTAGGREGSAGVGRPAGAPEWFGVVAAGKVRAR